MVSEYLKPLGARVLIPGWIRLVYVENRGAAFGILENHRWIFIASTILVILCFIYVILQKKVDHCLFDVSSILILGGGIGNLIDRIYLGYVVDYIELSFFSPVCNFADYCITFGTIFLIFYLIFIHEKDRS